MDQVMEELVAYRKDLELLLLRALREGDHPEKYVGFIEGEIYALDYALSVLRSNQSPPNGSSAV